MLPKDYASHVFINCPFDKQYQPIREAIIFAIFDCGFIPRSVLEENNSSDVRFEKIKHLISISKFGVHDISRTSLDSRNKLPRFNMPLELGVFIGAKKFGENYHRQKDIMILDKEAYRYQVFISDLAGQDIQAHNNDPAEAINKIRDWLNNASGRKTIPGGRAINKRYDEFKKALPKICKQFNLKANKLTYNDYCNFVSDWLKNKP